MMWKSSIISLLSLFLWFEANAQEARIIARYEGLDQLIGEHSFFDNHFTGFMLYDLDSQLVLFEKNSHMNFIPASTTKLLTFYGSLMILKDSVPSFRYVAKGEEITIWGTGNPSWLYEKLPQPKIEPFLKSFKTIKFSDSNWKDEGFGYGWQWDDYYYAYSAEKSPFPIYGNFVTYTNQKRTPVANIPYFGNVSIINNKNIKSVERSSHTNTFFFNPNTYTTVKSEVPFITSPTLFAELAKQRLNVPVTWVNDPLPETHKVFYNSYIRPMWKEVLQESDNFIAEQLLLLMSDELFRELNTERTITYITKNYLSDLPDKPQWVDGSGLSRHNLVTPRSMVNLMEKIDKAMPRNQLLQLLPQGGISGTIKNNYKAARPYVFAKTGTVSNNHALVGIIRTDSNKYLAFAFMNNNYLNKASEVRREMEKVMVFIKENF